MSRHATAAESNCRDRFDDVSATKRGSKKMSNDPVQAAEKLAVDVWDFIADTHHAAEW
jgi:hypothetical protein